MTTQYYKSTSALFFFSPDQTSQDQEVEQKDKQKAPTMQTDGALQMNLPPSCLASRFYLSRVESLCFFLFFLLSCLCHLDGCLLVSMNSFSSMIVFPFPREER